MIQMPQLQLSYFMPGAGRSTTARSAGGSLLGKRLKATAKKKELTSIGRSSQNCSGSGRRIARVDFFDSPYGGQVTSRLRQLRQAFAPEQPRPQAAAAAKSLLVTSTDSLNGRQLCRALLCIRLSAFA